MCAYQNSEKQMIIGKPKFPYYTLGLNQIQE